MVEPWEIRPESPTGDDTDHKVYAAVGKALTHWESVEVAVAMLFAYASGEENPDHTSPAVRAFGEVVSFRTRCDMTRTAVKAYINRYPKLESFEDPIRDSLKEAQNYSNRRNEIAHAKVMRLKDEETGLWLGYYLVPSFFNSKKFSLKNKPAFMYFAEDMKFYAGRFDIVSQKVFAWYRNLKTEPR